MKYTVCFYKDSHGVFSQYPLYDGVQAIAIDAIKRCKGLHGKQQLIVHRHGENGKFAFVLYNYTLNDAKEAFGVCFMTEDKFPQNVGYVFSCFGKVLSNIVHEGKVMHFDKQGKIEVSKASLSANEAYLEKHLKLLASTLEENKFSFSPFPSSYYKIYNTQAVVHQLSDKSWSVYESLKANDIVIVTKAIEDDNINSMRSIILTSNMKIAELEKENRTLLEQMKQRGIGGGPRKAKRNWSVRLALIFIILLSVYAAYTTRIILSNPTLKFELLELF